MANDSASGGYLVPTSEPEAFDLDLDVLFQGMVRGITGLPGEMVRPRAQPSDGLAAAQPRIPNQNEDWCAIGVALETPDFDPSVAHDGSGEGQDHLARFVTIEVLAGFYGPQSGAFAGRLADGIWIPQNREGLMLQGIDFVDATPIRSVPDIVNTIARRRKDLTLTFRRRIDRTYPVLNLRSASGTIRSETIDTPFNVES